MIPVVWFNECSDAYDAPDTLFEQCINYAVNHLDVIANVDPVTKDLHLKDGITLPSVICEKLLEVYQQNGYTVNDKFVTLFQNPETARVRRIKLRNALISNDGLRILLRSNPMELDISSCLKLTEDSLNLINKNGDSLISLSMGESICVLPDPMELSKGENSLYKDGIVLKTPNLKKLIIRTQHVSPKELQYYPISLKQLTRLMHLDLSYCLDVGNLSYLMELPQLTSLVLFGVPKLNTPNALTPIMKLKSLKHLDISQRHKEHGTFKYPNPTLAALVESLPNLVSLDISGTNLAGTAVADESMRTEEEYVLTDIPGLRSRVNNPLEFLGLYRTSHEACKRHNIPAKKISGDANEEQTLTAVQAYIDRTEVFINVLSDLFHLFRYEECSDINTALHYLLEAMDKYVHNKRIQISGSAILYYIAKLVTKKPHFKQKAKRHLIRTLINAMGSFQDDETVMRNVCLTLIQFNVPEDVLFDYERLVLLLVYVVSEVENQSFIQRIGIFLLNSLACQVDEAQKKILGNLGTVDKMLAIISDRLQRRVSDEVLDVAWSTMWNITDETIENCQRFLAKNGMELFLACLSMFPTKEEMLRNMMGLLGNVAEMKSLRPYLMSERFVPVFTELLGSCSDGIEVSYNAAGVLVHMCSDGEESWTVKEPKREAVLRKIVWAIRRWNLTAERNINYRSFQPILGLLKVTHTEECQYWAVWALANLTTVYREKYCPLVLNEGGIELLQTVIQTEHSHRAINKLAKIVIKNCKES